MTINQLDNIDKLEDSLWSAADNLRANSKLTAGEYCMLVLGVIFLRHATNRYAEALREIQDGQAASRMPKRPLTAADFKKRRALLLPKEARYDELLKLPKGADLGTALVNAMNAIERDFEPLQGQLPKDYTKFENTLLEDLLRVFDSETLRTAGGDLAPWIQAIRNLEERRRESEEVRINLESDMRDREAYVGRLTQQVQASMEEIKASQASAQQLQQELTACKEMLVKVSEVASEVLSYDSQLKSIAGEVMSKGSQLDKLAHSFSEASTALKALAKTSANSQPIPLSFSSQAPLEFSVTELADALNKVSFPTLSTVSSVT